MADPDGALAELRDIMAMVDEELARLTEPAPATAPLRRAVAAFRVLDTSAQRGVLPDAWAHWQRYRLQARWNGADAHPAHARRQLDAAGDPPPLARRVPGASGR